MTARREGIPVTDPARTIADLRRTRPTRGGATTAETGRAIRQASVLGLQLGPSETTDRTRSELEHRFLGLCESYRLPAPEVNVVVGGIEVDFIWKRSRLIVETDGYRYHRGWTAFQDDRRRDLRLRALGFEVVRLTYDQVTTESRQIASTLHSLLERGEFQSPQVGKSPR
jgi:very-short-patch-repair endonuclease